MMSYRCKLCRSRARFSLSITRYNQLLGGMRERKRLSDGSECRLKPQGRCITDVGWRREFLLNDLIARAARRLEFELSGP